MGQASKALLVRLVLEALVGLLVLKVTLDLRDRREARETEVLVGLQVRAEALDQRVFAALRVRPDSVVLRAPKDPRDRLDLRVLVDQ